MRAIASSLILTLPLFFAAGCDKKADDKKSDDKKADAKSSDDKQADAKPPEAPAEPELVMVEQDLTPAGADWAGWVAQGPEGAKVMGDLGKAARIAAGKQDFDLLFVPTKTDLAESKALVEKANADGTTKVAFTSDTPELLEWTVTGEGWTSYNFQMNMKAGELEVTCKILNGVKSVARRDAHKAACATLAKK